MSVIFKITVSSKYPIKSITYFTASGSNEFTRNIVTFNNTYIAESSIIPKVQNKEANTYVVETNPSKYTATANNIGSMSVNRITNDSIIQRSISDTYTNTQYKDVTILYLESFPSRKTISTISLIDNIGGQELIYLKLGINAKVYCKSTREILYFNSILAFDTIDVINNQNVNDPCLIIENRFKDSFIKSKNLEHIIYVPKYTGYFNTSKILIDRRSPEIPYIIKIKRIERINGSFYITFNIPANLTLNTTYN